MLDRVIDPQTLPDLPTRLGESYAISAPWGAGRAGSVWRARERDSQRDVALKLAPADPGSSNIEYRRSLHEARVLRRLAHPNALRVLDAGEIDGVAYWASPFLTGDTAAALLGGPLVPLDRVMMLLRDAAAALDHAALNGVIHGALVPRKILLDADGTAVVSDFRIDTLLPREPELELLPPAAYLAPELREGGLVDSRVDQYALAVIAYELLTGASREQEVAGRSLAAIELLDLKAGRPLRPGLRAEASEVIQRATLRDPSWRYATSTDFVQALTDAVAPRTDLAEPPARRRNDDEGDARRLAARRQRLQVGLLLGAACAGTYFAAKASFNDRLAIDRAVAANRRPAVTRVAQADQPTPRPQPAQPVDQSAELSPEDGIQTDSTSLPLGASEQNAQPSGAARPLAAAGVDGGISALAAVARRDDPNSGTVLIIPLTGAPEANVVVDSVNRGPAPVVLGLSAGRHHIQLRTEDGRLVTPADTVLIVGAGQTTQVAFRLNRFGTRATRRAAPALPVTPPRAPNGPSRAP